MNYYNEPEGMKRNGGMRKNINKVHFDLRDLLYFSASIARHLGNPQSYLLTRESRFFLFF